MIFDAHPSNKLTVGVNGTEEITSRIVAQFKS